VTSSASAQLTSRQPGFASFNQPRGCVEQSAKRQREKLKFGKLKTEMCFYFLLSAFCFLNALPDEKPTQERNGPSRKPYCEFTGPLHPQVVNEDEPQPGERSEPENQCWKTMFQCFGVSGVFRRNSRALNTFSISYAASDRSPARRNPFPLENVEPRFARPQRNQTQMLFQPISIIGKFKAGRGGPAFLFHKAAFPLTGPAERLY